MTEITLPAPLGYERAVELAHEVVAEAPADHVDPNVLAGEDCVYVDIADHEPSCIVSKILHRHGVPVDVLVLWEGKSARDLGPKGVRQWDGGANDYRYIPGPTAPLLADQETADFLHRLQGRQDGGDTWRNSLKQALDSAAA